MCVLGVGCEGGFVMVELRVKTGLTNVVGLSPLPRSHCGNLLHYNDSHTKIAQLARMLNVGLLLSNDNPTVM
jgi:hypothetical protein